MTSPKSSTTRRVLGDLNININTSVIDINHALRNTKMEKVSYSNHPVHAPLESSQVVGHSTTKLQRENWEETNTNTGSRVANMEEATAEDNVFQGLEITTTNNLELSIAERASLASKKRRLSSNVQFQDTISNRSPESHGKRRRMDPLSGNSSLLDGRGADVDALPQHTSSQPTASPSSDPVAEAKACDERVEITDESSDSGKGQKQKMPPTTPQKQSAPKCSSISASSSSSFPSGVDAEDSAIISNNSKLVETIISNKSTFIPTTISTPRTFQTSKSKSLSREEIRQKSQALRLRLSLANYKVKTNQIDLPLSRLQVCSTSPKLPSLARLRGYSHGKIMERTPLPGARNMDTGREAVPTINIQGPGSANKNTSVFVREKRGEREDGDENINVPSSPPLSGRESDSFSRRDSAISCTSFGSNSNSNSNPSSGLGLGHAHPLTPTLNTTSHSNSRCKETDAKMAINIEQEVARRKYEMIGGKENIKIQRTPILESQKIRLANPPMIFAQPEEEKSVSERGRSPELSRRAADGLVRLKLLR
ncbi:putative cyclin-dependent kinase protein [Botrytis cinerea BcDW1]|uniref:Uncharacterized protein n=2 Tax=Botryotinia fuckeliana TaxID=40559 RepID=G2YRD5_BOTF4|nr:putative cyclin-dependent kinase protein [Botrytis cinerea BcDW1]CCD54183.1 hypothetical protein BofuT4_P128830.1 [Botrytis cinerea T4]